jgi:hypothetical protein
MLSAKDKAFLKQLKNKIYNIKSVMINEGLTQKDINYFIH